jgi:hypothetical protein
MLKDAIFWVVGPYGSCENGCFGGTCRIPPKCRFSQDPHGATYEKMAIFIVTAEKVSNPTILCCSPAFNKS